MDTEPLSRNWHCSSVNLGTLYHELKQSHEIRQGNFSFLFYTVISHLILTIALQSRYILIYTKPKGRPRPKATEWLNRGMGATIRTQALWLPVQFTQRNFESKVYFQRQAMLFNTVAEGKTSPWTGWAIHSPWKVHTEDGDSYPWGNVTAFLPETGERLMWRFCDSKRETQCHVSCCTDSELFCPCPLYTGGQGPKIPCGLHRAWRQWQNRSKGKSG